MYSAAVTVVSLRYLALCSYVVYEGWVVDHNVIAASLLKLTWDTFGFDVPGTVFV
jgi:hypothetical protein